MSSASGSNSKAVVMATGETPLDARIEALIDARVQARVDAELALSKEKMEKFQIEISAKLMESVKKIAKDTVAELDVKVR